MHGSTALDLFSLPDAAHSPTTAGCNVSRRLIALAGLPPCDEDLSGISLGPVVRNPPTTGTGVGQEYAFSQFPRE